MIKELVISIILVIMIFGGNFLSQGYLDKSIEETSNELEELKEIIKVDDVDNDMAREKIIRLTRKGPCETNTNYIFRRLYGRIYYLFHNSEGWKTC